MNDKSGWIFAIASYRFLEAFWTEDYDPLQGRFFFIQEFGCFFVPRLDESLEPEIHPFENKNSLLMGVPRVPRDVLCNTTK